MSAVSYREFSGSGAENYQRYFVPAIGLPVARELMRTAALAPGERVLDVACGTGVIARLAAEQVGPEGAVTAVDVAADMIEVARSVPSSGAPIDWRTGGAEALALADGSFDVALCQMGLMFMDDPAAALAEMHRVLGSEGRIVVSTPGAIQRPFELMEQAIVEHIDAELGGFVRAVFSMPDPDAVGDLLRGAGFDDVTASLSAAQLELPAPAEFLWQYIHLTPMGPLVDRAPETARAAMERDVVEAWQPWVVGGATVFEQPMVIAAARK